MFVLFGVETWEGVSRLPRQLGMYGVTMEFNEADHASRNAVADFFHSCVDILDIKEVRVEINPLPSRLHVVTQIGMVDTIGSTGDCQMSVYAIRVA
jgi:hypothetical protein